MPDCSRTSLVSGQDHFRFSVAFPLAKLGWVVGNFVSAVAHDLRGPVARHP
jgi:hypothetical protein